MFKRWTWYLLVFLVLAGGTILTGGFWQAFQVTQAGDVSILNKKISQPPQSVAATAVPAKKANSLQIVVLGDSIGRGTGDLQGQGLSTYVPQYFRKLTAKELAVENVAIDGLKTTGLFEQLANPQLQMLLSRADLVILSIGGNDLRSLRAADDATKQGEFAALEQSYLTGLQDSLQKIRKSNPTAYLVFVGLYNPYENTSSTQDTKLLHTWNFDTQQIVEADPKAVFIPTYDLFRFNLPKYLASDGLHPNTLGYQTVSSRIVKALENTLLQ